MALDPIQLKTLALELAATLPPAPAEAGNAAPLDTSPRARRMRAITRIADRYGWHSAITHFLDTRGAAYMSDLSDPQLEDLHERMEGYVDAAETGASLVDCFPAT
jgi:hypothetical protein